MTKRVPLLALGVGLVAEMREVGLSAGQQVRIVIGLQSKGTPRRTRCSA